MYCRGWLLRGVPLCADLQSRAALQASVAHQSGKLPLLCGISSPGGCCGHVLAEAAEEEGKAAGAQQPVSSANVCESFSYTIWTVDMRLAADR